MVKNENTEFEINVIKENFLKTYLPVQSFDKEVFFMSTYDIFNSIHNLYPSKEFKPDTVASWLFEGGFKFIDMGNLKFEWMLKTDPQAPP